jgi:ABC-2 type transport system ATP-binding protein
LTEIHRTIILRPSFKSNTERHGTRGRLVVIQVTNLTKYFGRTAAVDNISFEVAKGEIVGFLGPNGAGKTTTMRILAGFMPATGGTSKVAGFDVYSQSLDVRRRIGYLPESVAFYPEMRVEEYLRYRGRIKGVRGRRLRQRLAEVLESCGLSEVRRSVIGRLSKGYRQRLGLADALIHEPELLILDEPTIGLDPNQIRHVRNLIRGLGQRHTILLSSHILSEIEMTCERVMIIKRGRIVASDTTENLLNLMKGKPEIQLEVQGPSGIIESRLMAIDGMEKVTMRPSGDWVAVTCICRTGADLRQRVFETAAADGWKLRELRMERRNLEDVFVEITAEPRGAPEAV